MPYKSKSELAREDWMTVPDVVAYIRSADNCKEEEAGQQLRKALTDGVLGVLKWEREKGGKPPPFGYTPIVGPTDTPPVKGVWLTAKIRWKTGEVRNDWGEFKHGEWRVLLIRRFTVLRLWPASETGSHADSDSNEVTKIPRKRGPKTVVRDKIRDKMRKDLREKPITRSELENMKEEALAQKYETSRDTARKARKEVLSESEFVGNTPTRISDK